MSEMIQIVREILDKHGYCESGNKQGLFFNKVDDSTVVYCDLRKAGRPNFYGFINNSDAIDKVSLDEMVSKVKQELSSIGIVPLHTFDQDKQEGTGIMNPPKASDKDAEDDSEEEPTKAEQFQTQKRLLTGPHCEGCYSVAYVKCPHCGENVCKVCGGKIVESEDSQ